jgi:hypothetical protein
MLLEENFSCQSEFLKANQNLRKGGGKAPPPPPAMASTTAENADKEAQDTAQSSNVQPQQEE